METTVRQENMRTLGQRLQALFGETDISLGVRCALKDEGLIVVGQHQASTMLDPRQTLKALERTIQSLQPKFIQQVRLYLQVAGQKQPYAHRRFRIQPPAPPPNPHLCNSQLGGFYLEQTESETKQDCYTSDEFFEPLRSAHLPFAFLDEIPWTDLPIHPEQEETDEWAVADEELDALISELTTGGTQLELEDLISVTVETKAEAIASEWFNFYQANNQANNGSSHLYVDAETGDAASDEAGRGGALAKTDASGALLTQLPSNFTPILLSDLEPIAIQFPPLQESWTARINGKAAIATGVAALGLAGGAYGLTRPCSISSTCPEVQTAQRLNLTSVQAVQTATTKADLEHAQRYSEQAVEVLETIPVWSGQAREAQSLKQGYEVRAIALEQLIAAEETATAAAHRSQHPPYSVEKWQIIQSLWQSAIHQLEKISTEDAFYPFAQRRLRDYRVSLAEVEQRVQTEQQAQHTLGSAKQTLQLAEARGRIAQSLANWQLARATWQVAVTQLQKIPADTAAAIEAKRLLTAYEPKLIAANNQVGHEQTAAGVFTKATQQAQKAQASEKQSNWRQAVADWNAAIAYVQDIPPGTTYRTQAAFLVDTYKKALDRSKQKLRLTEQIETELSKVCSGEPKLCTLISVGISIKVQMHESYTQALNAAADTGNPNLQALIENYKTSFGNSLESIATQFQLPVEVYDHNNEMLDRHAPRPRSSLSTLSLPQPGLKPEGSTLTPWAPQGLPQRDDLLPIVPVPRQLSR